VRLQALHRLHNYSTIIPLFHLHSTSENYSKTPQNGIEIIPSGDPGLRRLLEYFLLLLTRDPLMFF
jgi:hypothetical protein